MNTAALPANAGQLIAAAIQHGYVTDEYWPMVPTLFPLVAGEVAVFAADAVIDEPDLYRRCWVTTQRSWATLTTHRIVHHSLHGLWWLNWNQIHSVRVHSNGAAQIDFVVDERSRTHNFRSILAEGVFASWARTTHPNHPDLATRR